MRRSLLTFGLSALMLLLTACGGRSSAPQAANVNNAAPVANNNITLASACECPQLPTVATSESPAPGKAYLELSEADLNQIFSNRNQIYQGTWRLGFQALDTDIDPTGELHINRGPHPEPTYDVSLQEGTLSAALLKPPPPIGSPGLPQPMRQLLITIARTNKYGEPEPSLRNDSIRAARFLAGDLATVPVQLQTQGSRAIYVAAQSYVARVALRGALAAAGAKQVLSHPVDPVLAAQQIYDTAAHTSSLRLDRFDIANAALDVLRSVDAQSHEDGLFDPRTERDVNIVDELVDIASARSIFGGFAQPGSPQDDVACKAFVTLVRLANKDYPETRPLRDQLVSWIMNSGRPFAGMGSNELQLAKARFYVAQAALALSGPADADEARFDADALFNKGVVAASQGNNPNPVADTMYDFMAAAKFFQVNAGGESGDYRDAIAAEYDRLLQDIKDRLKAGTGARYEQTFLDAWPETQIDRSLQTIARTPACTTGNCEADYLKEKPTVTREDWLERPTILVRVPGHFAAETLDTVVLGQPVEVSLRSPSSGAGSVTVTNERTGSSHAVKLGVMEPLDPNAEDGDTLRLDAPNATPIEIVACKDVYQQTIVRSRQSLDTLFAVYLTELQDSGAVDDPPAVAAARVAAIRMKLHAIANARLLLNYEPRPDDRFSVWPATRAEIGMQYVAFVQTDPATWNEGTFYQTGPNQAFKGEDSRFPGVNYQSYEESHIVNLALQNSKDEMDAIVLRALRHMSVGLFQSYVAASCFELNMTKVPFCPEDFWILVMGVDAGGNELSSQDRWLHGITMAYPLVLQFGDKLGTLETYSGRQYVPEHSNVRQIAQALTEAGETQTARRSETIRPDQRDLPVGSAPLLDSDFRWYDQESFPEAVKYVPKSFNRFAKPGKALSPGSFLQIADNTCGLTVYERIRRLAGLPARTEATNIRLAYSRSRYISRGGAYDGVKGSYRDGMILMYEGDGGRVLNVEPATLNLHDIELELMRGRYIYAALEIPTSTSNGIKLHAVQIEEILHYADGRTEVLYWDPWSGNQWTMDVCHFKKRWWPRETIIVDMSKAYQRLR